MQADSLSAISRSTKKNPQKRTDLDEPKLNSKFGGEKALDGD